MFAETPVAKTDRSVRAKHWRQNLWMFAETPVAKTDRSVRAKHLRQNLWMFAETPVAKTDRSVRAKHLRQNLWMFAETPVANASPLPQPDIINLVLSEKTPCCPARSLPSLPSPLLPPC